MAAPFGRQTSREALQETTRHLKSSFTEGSSRIFGSVMGAKKGLFDGISSTFDQVVNIVGNAEEGQGSTTASGEPSAQCTPIAEEDKSAATAATAASAAAATGGTAVKPKPPKPPAPMSKQRSDLDSNGSVRTLADNQSFDDASRPAADSPSGRPSRMTEKPPLKRRNTNPFMDDYDPSAVEPDLPNTVVAEVHQLVTALYSGESIETNQKAASTEETVNRQNSSASRSSVPGTDGQTKANRRGSDADSEGTEGCDEQPDVDDLDQEHAEYAPDCSVVKSGSRNSDQSWSNTAEDAYFDPVAKECADFMKYFVAKVFDVSSDVTPKDKSKFGEFSQNGTGRLWFARSVSSQKSKSKKIAEETFYGLVQFYTIILFECNEGEDYGPAKTLMNTCFEFYTEVDKSKGTGPKQFLYSFLKDLPIWHSPRYWNAAFFYAIQHERAAKPTSAKEDEKRNTDQGVQDLSFVQLGLITSCMRALGLNKDQTLEFIRRQSSTANLTADQLKTLRQNMERWTEQSLPCFQADAEESGAFWFISKKAKAVNAAARLLKEGWSIGGLVGGAKEGE